MLITLITLPVVSLASGGAKLASNLGKQIVCVADTGSATVHSTFNHALNASFQIVDGMVNMAESFVGVPYLHGGTSMIGFDCSGFVSHIFKSFGLEIPRSSCQQAKLGAKISKDEAQKGDLLFFRGRGRHAGIGHVALVLSNDNGELKIAHATNSRGVIVEMLNADTYFLSRFVKAVRVNYLKLLPVQSE